MRVKNRAGVSVEVSYDKIQERLQALCARGPRDADSIDDDTSGIDVDEVVLGTVKGMYDGVTTSELDDMSARVCDSLRSKFHGYDVLAGRIAISNLHKTSAHALEKNGAGTCFSAKMRHLRASLSPAFAACVERHAATLDAMLDYERDYGYNYFSVRTMERMRYLLCAADGTVIESPQDMWMRVSVAVCLSELLHEEEEERMAAAFARVRAVYDGMSRGLFTHATPTLFNAGTRFQQMSSCYLLGVDDSLDGIYATLGKCAQISKWAGGIGMHVSNVRAKGSRIASTNGKSDGIVPMLKVFNETARYCNQSGKRNGSIAVYLEPWHADVFEFVELKKNTGAETERTRDLFLALWVPDLFMRRVLADGPWHLMSPDACPGLQDAHGSAFDALYEGYETAGRFVRRVSARALWHHVLNCQLETGVPYMMFKDTVNALCNQSNLGTIRSSNLCAEITEYSDAGTYAVCNLASIAVNRFVRGRWGNLVVGPGGRTARRGMSYDFAALHAAAKTVTYNLNDIIDANFYPTPETAASNAAARPIGIGVQGFADLYCALGLQYEDENAMQLDAEVMETIYHGALEASVELARRDGPYPRFAGSPFSRGQLQQDLWRAHLPDAPLRAGRNPDGSARWDWGALRADVARHGTRNSLLTALMPTATTSQILGNSESFEPFNSNVFKRTTKAGQFMVMNKALMRDMAAAGVWREQETMNELLEGNGSVQALAGVPAELRALYKTAFEIPQRAIMDHAIARAPYVDQSQSMNLFHAVPNTQKLNSALIYAWKHGLKTGVYYLRSMSVNDAAKTQKRSAPVAPHDSRDSRDPHDAAAACRLGAVEGEACAMCSA